MPVVRRSQRNRKKLEETREIVESVTVKANAKSVKHTKKVTFNPKVQLFLYPLTGAPERIRPPVFCQCDESSSSPNEQRIPCDSCNQWHTLRCLNIPANSQITEQKKSCIRCRKRDLWRKILTKIQIGQPLHYKEVFSVSKKLHIQPSGTTADILVRLVCFLMSDPQDCWSKPQTDFGKTAQLELLADAEPEMLTATLEVAKLSIKGRMRDRVKRLHRFLTANLLDKPNQQEENTAPHRPMTPAKKTKQPANNVKRQAFKSKSNSRANSRASRSKRNANPAWNEEDKPHSRRVLGDRTNTMKTPPPQASKKTRQPLKKSPLPPGEQELWELATEFRSSLDVFTREELRTECMNCGLRRGGTKAELAQRLALYLAQQEHRVKATQKNRGRHPASCECQNCMSSVIQSLAM